MRISIGRAMMRGLSGVGRGSRCMDRDTDTDRVETGVQGMRAGMGVREGVSCRPGIGNEAPVRCWEIRNGPLPRRNRIRTPGERGIRGNTLGRRSKPRTRRPDPGSRSSWISNRKRPRVWEGSRIPRTCTPRLLSRRRLLLGRPRSVCLEIGTGTGIGRRSDRPRYRLRGTGRS